MQIREDFCRRLLRQGAAPEVLEFLRQMDTAAEPDRCTRLPCGTRQSIVSPEFAREALQIARTGQGRRAAADRPQPRRQADAPLLVHDAAQPGEVRPVGPGRRSGVASRPGRP